MAYKDKKKEAAYHKRWYQSNKLATKVRARVRREIAREWYKEYKSNLWCQRCGEDHPACLEFHHRDSKKYEVSSMVNSGYSVASILKEIQKCDVLCANCHRKITMPD